MAQVNIILTTLSVLTIVAVTAISAKQILVKDVSYFREPPVPKAKSLARDMRLETIEQHVDNFDPQNNATYKMRYYRNDEFFKPGAPILIYIGGEWSVTGGWIRGGHMYDMAKELNAQMFYTEHRYYGESRPTPNASTHNLRFLNVEQALADLAHFITTVKTEPGKENSKVVVIGASYAATMAAWFRQKYPHLAAGAWASSGPVNAKIDMWEYKEVVGAAVRQIGGEKCFDRINQGIRGAEALLEGKDFDRLKQLFRFCDFDTERQENIWRAFSWLGGSLSGTVQYHWPGDIEGVCADILNDTSDTLSDLEEFARWHRSRYFRENDTESCLNINYDDSIKYYQEIEWDQDATDDDRQWTYQTCTEFGWYQTSTSPYQPFGSNFPIEYYLKRCEDIFGKDVVNRENLAKNIAWKNTMYGGLNPAVTNVYFTNGKVDPWRTMAVQANVGPTSPADIISTSAHCMDLYSVNEFGIDTQQMLSVKMRIKRLVKEWVK